MIQQTLQQHQWKAFRRHSMFGRNKGVRIFLFILFGILALYLLGLGFLLNNVLVEIVPGAKAIDTFNSFLLYLFLGDFLLKFALKKSQSMQIAPYLTLPIKRNRLFDFLLIKEFSNVWNLYWLFLIIPFSISAIMPFYGFGSAFIYWVFFYLLCVSNSLLARICDNLFNQHWAFLLLPIGVALVIPGLDFGVGIDFESYMQAFGELILQKDVLVWLALIIVLLVLWKMNHLQMRAEIYRGMQGEKVTKASAFSGFAFLDRLGEIGEFINLELKMITRGKRLRTQMFMTFFFVAYAIFQLYTNKMIQENFFMNVFWSVLMIGFFGMVMGQFIFTAESASFDGLMARNHSLLNVLRAKYLLYTIVSVVVLLVFLIPAYHGKLSFLLVISSFFFAIGLMYFGIFQNAVYNKSYIDIFESGFFNWKGTSSNMLLVAMLVMIVPIALVAILGALTSRTVACYFMLVSGVAFTVTADRWLKWTHRRFLKRKYQNMEGFRAG